MNSQSSFENKAPSAEYRNPTTTIYTERGEVVQEELTLLRLAELYARVNTCNWDPLLGAEPTDRKKKINETCRICKELVDTVGPDVTELLWELHCGGNLNSWLKKRWNSRKMRKKKSFKAELIEVVVSTVVAVITAVLTVWLI